MTGVHSTFARRTLDQAFRYLSRAILLGVLGVLGLLLVDVLTDGASRLSWAFLAGSPSRHPETAGILPALVGSLMVVAVMTALTVPIGIGAGVYLEEYAGHGRLARLIEWNITSLAGVPSIVYGLLGLGLLVRTLGLGRSVLAGAATLGLLILPVVILASREALRAVPSSLRDASYALGATQWQTIRHQVLPAAWPAILAGVLLALARALGEAAPLIALGALTFVPFLPDGVWSPFTALPIQIFNWISRPQAAFGEAAAAGIIVLLVILISMNAMAVWLRTRSQL